MLFTSGSSTQYVRTYVVRFNPLVLGTMATMPIGFAGGRRTIQLPIT